MAENRKPAKEEKGVAAENAAKQKPRQSEDPEGSASGGAFGRRGRCLLVARMFVVCSRLVVRHTLICSFAFKGGMLFIRSVAL
jgi:hypothetical protein